MEEIFIEIIEFFDTEMEPPQPYGLFHLCWLAISILAGGLLCRLMPKGTQGQVRAVVLTVALVVIAFELYKQITLTFNVKDGELVSKYLWWSFPWQFCSIPMYVGLLAGLTRGKFHKSMCAFLGSFALFAGLLTMFYPATLFSEIAGINIQTMICHGSMITVGIYLYYTGYIKAEGKTFLRAVPVFLGAIAIAMVLNELAYYGGLLEEGSFNMFYINPHSPPTLVVFKEVQKFVPFPWDVAIYVSVFILASYLVVMLARLLLKLKKEKAAV